MSKTLASIAALLLTSLAGMARADVVAHWNFDRTLPDGTYLDLSNDHSHAATPQDKGAVSAYSGKAPFGNAVTFNGTPGAYLNIPAITTIQTGSFTVAAWVNMTSPDQNFILTDWPSTTKAGFVFGFDPLKDPTKAEPIADMVSAQTTGQGNRGNRMSVARLQLNGVDPRTRKDRTVPLNEWHHIAWTWNRDAGVLTCYVDGASIGQQNRAGTRGLSNSMDLVVNNKPMRIGSREWVNPTSKPMPVFHGSMDELWVFNVALSTEQLANLIKTNNIEGTPVVARVDATPPATPVVDNTQTPATPETSATPTPDVAPLAARSVVHEDLAPATPAAIKSTGGTGRSLGVILCLVWAITLSSYVAWGIKERTKLKSAGRL